MGRPLTLALRSLLLLLLAVAITDNCCANAYPISEEQNERNEHGHNYQRTREREAMEKQGQNQDGTETPAEAAHNGRTDEGHRQKRPMAPAQQKANSDGNRTNLRNVNAASCYDSRLSGFINNGLYYYSHNMGQLSKYIIDQIKRAGYAGFWFVHAAMIGGQTQGLQWQSQSNGDIFSAQSRHGCYYHDTQTYIIIIRY